MARDQSLDQRLRLLGEGPETVGVVMAEMLLEPVLVAPLAGMELAAVAPRRAPADALGLDDGDVDPGFGEMERRREPGVAAAEDGDVHLRRRVECRERQCAVGTRRVERGSVSDPQPAVRLFSGYGRSVAMRVAGLPGDGLHVDVRIEGGVVGQARPDLEDHDRPVGAVLEAVAVVDARPEPDPVAGPEDLRALVGDERHLALDHPDQLVASGMPVALARPGAGRQRAEIDAELRQPRRVADLDPASRPARLVERLRDRGSRSPGAPWRGRSSASSARLTR